jgi:FkbM family methyltransferase
MLGNRSLTQILKGITGRQHYIALGNMFRNYPNFLENTYRYLTAKGEYPYNIKVRTPVGLVEIALYTHHDILTVNEIFCRLDYPADEQTRVVVDLGSNIGVSGLYFLTRNNISKCYLFEPDQRNIEKLKTNLSNFSDRYVFHGNAVSYESGQLEFGIEPTGRYGGIGVATEKTITVDCLDINQVLKSILAEEDHIDILKIDTEGVEIRTVEAIDKDLLKRIKKIYLEAKPERELHPDMFTQKQYGSVCQMVNIKALA